MKFSKKFGNYFRANVKMFVMLAALMVAMGGMASYLQIFGDGSGTYPTDYSAGYMMVDVPTTVLSGMKLNYRRI